MGVKRAEENAPISAAPSKIQVAEKEKSFHDQRKAAEKSLQAKKFALS
jgi:hypothetical protein